MTGFFHQPSCVEQKNEIRLGRNHLESFVSGCKGACAGYSCKHTLRSALTHPAAISIGAGLEKGESLWLHRIAPHTGLPVPALLAPSSLQCDALPHPTVPSLLASPKPSHPCCAHGGHIVPSVTWSRHRHASLMCANHCGSLLYPPPFLHSTYSLGFTCLLSINETPVSSQAAPP